MLKEFKEFILKGDIIDIAIGLLIATAFAGIVAALTKDFINPIIGLFGKADFSSMMLVLKDGSKVPGPYANPAAASAAGAVAIFYGDFLSVVINFLITALVIFIILKAYKKATEKPALPVADPEPTKEEILLSEIRDLLKTNPVKS